MPDSKKPRNIFEFAARKATQRPVFLASALESFQELENLDASQLADWLEITPAQLNLLALCKRPNPSEANQFRRDTAAIAEKFSIAPAKLANLIRQAASYEASQESAQNAGQNSLLMAARDYEKPTSSENDSEAKNKPEKQVDK